MRFNCERCGIEIFGEDVLDIPAGWSDGEGKEIVTCPDCGHECSRIDREEP